MQTILCYHHRTDPKGRPNATEPETCALRRDYIKAERQLMRVKLMATELWFRAQNLIQLFPDSPLVPVLAQFPPHLARNALADQIGNFSQQFRKIFRLDQHFPRALFPSDRRMAAIGG